MKRGASGAYFVLSADVPGLGAASPDRDGLDKLIPKYLEDIYKASGLDVRVFQVESEDDPEAFLVFAIIPADIIRQQLEQME